MFSARRVFVVLLAAMVALDLIATINLAYCQPAPQGNTPSNITAPADGE